MNGKFYFTPSGVAKMQKKIHELEKKLVDLRSQINHVAEHCGDSLYENQTIESLNFDMLAANRGIVDAIDALSRVIVVQPSNTPDKVAIGTKVKIVHDLEESSWEILGFGESDHEHNVMAYNTPLASLIIGKCRGEVARGIIAGRQTMIQIIEITKGEQNLE